MRISDWSSDVCSSDLDLAVGRVLARCELRLYPLFLRLRDGDALLDHGVMLMLFTISSYFIPLYPTWSPLPIQVRPWESVRAGRAASGVIKVAAHGGGGGTGACGTPAGSPGDAQADWTSCPTGVGLIGRPVGRQCRRIPRRPRLRR